MPVLAGHEPESQQQVARRLGVDRRRNVVELTGHGQDVVVRATRASDEAERALLAPLGAREGQRLRDALQRIVTQRDADSAQRLPH